MINWVKAAEFHKEIAIKADENNYILLKSDCNSSRHSFIKYSGLINDQILTLNSFTNPQIIGNIVDKEVYIGGCMWSFAGKIDARYQNVCSPMIIRKYNVVYDEDSNEVKLLPQVGNWTVSPFFLSFLSNNSIKLDDDFQLDSEIHKIINNYCNDENFDKYIKDCITSTFPALSEIFKTSCEQWVLFTAPEEFGIIQKNLIEDYCNLINKLKEDSKNIGCLQYFDNVPDFKEIKTSVSEFVPLNENQLKAVQRVISGYPVSAISGPPGCGKSQVVISIMLNAWRNSQSVLFVSTNNKAVDVVFDRIKEHEGGILQVIRAGSKNYTKLVPRLNMIRQGIGKMPSIPASSESEYKRVEANLKNIVECLNTNIPKQVDELVSKAIIDHVEMTKVNDEINQHKNMLEKSINDTIFTNIAYDDFQSTVYVPIFKWIDDYKELIAKLDGNETKAEDLKSVISDKTNQADNILSKYYFSSISIWNVPLDVTSNCVLWYREVRDYFINNDLSFLDKSQIKEEYSKWASDKDCQIYIDKVSYTIDIISEIECTKDILNIQISFKALNELKNELSSVGLKPIDKEKYEILTEWKQKYSLYLEKKHSKFYAIPFSEYKRLDKQLTSIEYSLIDIFGAVKLQGFEKNEIRHAYIYDNLSLLFNHFEACEEFSKYDDIKQTLNNRLFDINYQLKQLNIDNIILPTHIEDIDSTDILSKAKAVLSEDIALCKSAAEALENNYKKKNLISLINAGNESFCKQLISCKDISFINKFSDNMNFSNDNVDYNKLSELRSAILSNDMLEFIGDLENFVLINKDIINLQNFLLDIPKSDMLQKEWMDRRPDALAEIYNVYDFTYYSDKISETEQNIKTLSELYNGTNETILPLLERKEDLLSNAKSAVTDGIKLIEDKDATFLKTVLLNNAVISEVRAEICKEYWDYDIVKKLATYNNLLSKKNQYELQKQKYLIEKALLDKHLALKSDLDIKSKISLLINDYENNNNKITAQGQKVFSDVLKSAPMWITTDHSPQSIPMEAGIFDILVIDEATQCNITSVLPLLYRCKRIVVIGDEKQLPSINSISKYSEQAIAESCGMSKDGSYSNLLSKQLNHVGCNIYRTVFDVCNCDEIMLVEHYRCHPLIIAFSNYYIYQRKLMLNSIKSFSATDGMFGINVKGKAEKGNKSWFNQNEANKVAEVVKELMSSYPGKSIGIITPFRKQADIIGQQVGIDEAVRISTVHDYQGDEKDIIIFSPVVSYGMNAETIKWVEEPENLINVAVTRAREMFYIVADYDVCGMTRGILGKLIKYVKTVTLLRETSEFELKLYSLMVMQGWKIDVHKIINDIEVDFVVGKTVIEVDGSQHLQSKREDEARDGMLKAFGFEVLRFSPNEIEYTPINVIEKIKVSLL